MEYRIEVKVLIHEVSDKNLFASGGCVRDESPIIKYLSFHNPHKIIQIADRIIKILQQIEWFLDMGRF